jgi:hypothetical protein
MKVPRSPSLLLCLLFCLLLCSVSGLAASLVAGSDDWKPVDPAELALKAPIVEKDADAEAVFWEVRIDDSHPEELSLMNYVRIKVFNDRGKEAQSKVDLPYFGSHRIKDIAARVIKADGTIVELKKEDVFERTIVKASGVKIKAKSFALPSVEAGCLIEYRWRDVHPYGSANRLRLYFQRDIPIQTVTYFLKPFSGMQYLPFRMGEARFVKDKDGFSKITVANMPAFIEEPKMPPEDEERSWVFLFYTDASKMDADKYWKELGKQIFEATKDEMKVNDEVKSAIAGIIGDAATPEEKLRRIYDFCHIKIKNTSDDASGISDDEKKKLKENKSPGDTIKRGMGTGSNIDMLFAALAKAAGFDARLALSGNRDDLFFDRSFANAYFLESSFIAVRVGEEWQYFSPAEMYTSFGMLGWPEENQEALITDAKEPMWVKTSTSPPEKSLEKRTARLHLLDDGTIEGDIDTEYSGHFGADKKEYNDDDSPAQREETLRNSLKARMSTAEISNIKIENVTDPLKPFVYRYHIRVAGYAQRTGKRIFLQPAFFEHGLSPLFSASNRKHPVYFHYPWSEEDDVTIQMPAGYALDNADAPNPITIAKLGEYSPKILVSTDGKTLFYKRRLSFGNGGLLLFPTNTYTDLKSLFDQINKSDNHTITLKQTLPTGGSN